MPRTPFAVTVPATVVPFVVSMTVIESGPMEDGSTPGVIVASTVVVSETLVALFEGMVDETCGGCATITRSPTLTTASAAGDEPCVYVEPSPVATVRGTSVNGAAGAAATGRLKMPETRERSATPSPAVETRASRAAPPLPNFVTPRANAIGAFAARST